MRRFNNLWNYSVQFESLILCQKKTTQKGGLFWQKIRIGILTDLNARLRGSLARPRLDGDDTKIFATGENANRIPHHQRPWPRRKRMKPPPKRVVFLLNGCFWGDGFLVFPKQKPACTVLANGRKWSEWTKYLKMETFYMQYSRLSQNGKRCIMLW